MFFLFFSLWKLTILLRFQKPYAFAMSFCYKCAGSDDYFSPEMYIDVVFNRSRNSFQPAPYNCDDWENSKWNIGVANNSSAIALELVGHSSIAEATKWSMADGFNVERVWIYLHSIIILRSHWDDKKHGNRRSAAGYYCPLVMINGPTIRNVTLLNQQNTMLFIEFLLTF